MDTLDRLASLLREARKLEREAYFATIDGRIEDAMDACEGALDAAIYAVDAAILRRDEMVQLERWTDEHEGRLTRVIGKEGEK